MPNHPPFDCAYVKETTSFTFFHTSSPSFSLSYTLLMSFLSLMILGMGCTENKIDTSPNILPAPQGDPNQGGGTGGVMGGPQGGAQGGIQGGMQGEAPCRTCIQEGSFYRFTELSLTSLDGNETHPVIGTLNSLWAGDVENHQLNILFEIKEVTEDRIKVSALNAAWNGEGDNDYCLLTNTAIEFDFTRSGCGFVNEDPAGINIYAGSQEFPKNCSVTDEFPNTIPVRDVTLEGAFNDTCDEIISGLVPSALIAKQALDQTCTCLIGPASPLDACKGPDSSYMGDADGQCGGCNDSYRSLNSLLSAFGELSYSCDDGGNPAVCIDARYKATRLNFTPEVCQ